MLNLNIGDVVYHAGKKRAIEASKSVAGRTFFKLSGHAYMVRLDHVKPVIRVGGGITLFSSAALSLRIDRPLLPWRLKCLISTELWALVFSIYVFFV